MSRLLERLWPSRSEHRKLLQSSEETRRKMLKLTDTYRTASVVDVMDATEQAADFR